MRAATRAAIGVLVAIVAVVWVANPALGSFGDSATPSAGMTVATATLAPPGDPSLAPGTCSTLTGDSVRVTWTASTSSWTDGYEVLRALTSSGPWMVVADLPPSTLTFTETGLAFSTTMYYRVQSTKAGWTSVSSTTTITTRSLLCL